MPTNQIQPTRLATGPRSNEQKQAASVVGTVSVDPAV